MQNHAIEPIKLSSRMEGDGIYMHEQSKSGNLTMVDLEAQQNASRPVVLEVVLQ